MPRRRPGLARSRLRVDFQDGQVVGCSSSTRGNVPGTKPDRGECQAHDCASPPPPAQRTMYSRCRDGRRSPRATTNGSREKRKKKKGPLWIGSLLRIRLRYFGELNAVQAQRLRRPLKDSDQRSGTDGSGQNTHKRVLPVEKGDVERWGHAQTDSQMLHACSSARWW